MIDFAAAPAPAPEETLPLDGGTAWVLLAPGHRQLRCPLIVVEGFPGGHGFAYSWGVLAQQGVLSALQGAGYDLVVVGLDDGLRSILDNAAVLKDCISQVTARTELPLTVLGWSMGGLIARVALCELEDAGRAHHVVTLVTWDTPHRGTITQLGVQWLVAHLREELPALAPFAQQLDSVANQEMDLIWLAADGTAAESPHRRALVEQLRWPAQPRRVLISCGRGDGQITLSAGHVLVHWDGGEHGHIELRAAGGAEPIADGSFAGRRLPSLPGDALAALDGAPGGREGYPAQAAAVLNAVVAMPPGSPPPPTCTVPTVSALDLDGDLGAAVAPGIARPALAVVAPPSTRICCETDQPHLVITAASAPAIIDAIGPPFDPERFNPRALSFLADPFPVYQRFRSWAPISPVPAYASLWCFGAEDCQAILTGTADWLKAPVGGNPPHPGPSAAMDAFAPGLFSSDPPSHTAIRAAVQPLIEAAALRSPEITGTHAAQLLAGLQGRGRIELVQDYALPLPSAVLFDLLGLPDDPLMRQALVTWQTAITIAHDSTQPVATLFSGLTSDMALRTFWVGLVARQRQAPTPGLLGELCDSFAAHGLADELLYATLCDLLVAGYLSTTFLIGTGTWRLLQHPDALAQVRQDRTLLRPMINELLRLDGPVQVIDRYAATELSLSGRTLPAGTKVTAVVGSADRDPWAHQDPDALLPGRTDSHFAFGRGIHTCVGAPLVEQVAPVAFGALLDLPVLELDGEPQWQTDPYLRAATSVPVRIA